MKIDPEKLFHASKLDKKSESRPVEGYIDNLDSERLSSGEDTMKGSENGALSGPNGLKNGIENAGIYEENHVRESNLSSDHSVGESKSFDSGSDKLYSDKNVMEYDLPELLVCYKENPENVVKDICVDEGLPCKEKTLLGNVAEKFDKNCVNFPEKEDESESMKGISDTSMPILEGVKFSEKSDSDRDYSLKCDSKDSRESWYSSSAEDSMEEMEDENSDCKRVGTQYIQVADKEANSCTSESVSEPGESNILTGEMASSAHEQSPSENSANTTVSKEEPTQSGNITPDSDSSPPAISSSREGSPPKGVSKHIESHNIPRTEEGIPGSLLISNRFQQGFGETSFSLAGPVSGRISYSGGVPYSGSLSLRSDSSTTSNRSFAFPVLQGEWNGSPARMAKADRRLLRKHKSWTHTLLCCKF